MDIEHNQSIEGLEQQMVGVVIGASGADELEAEGVRALHDTYSSKNKQHELLMSDGNTFDDFKHLKLKVEIENRADNNSRLTYNSSLRMKINESQLKDQSNQMTNLNRNVASNLATNSKAEAGGNFVRKSSFQKETTYPMEKQLS